MNLSTYSADAIQTAVTLAKYSALRLLSVYMSMQVLTMCIMSTMAVNNRVTDTYLHFSGINFCCWQSCSAGSPE